MPDLFEDLILIGVARESAEWAGQILLPLRAHTVNHGREILFSENDLKPDTFGT